MKGELMKEVIFMFLLNKKTPSINEGENNG